MNNRRQTIWLVSMLSLMVILSAYYLFTEDASPVGQTADQASGYQTQQDAGATDGSVQITQVDGTDGAAGADALTNGQTDSQTDSEGADATALPPTGAATDTTADQQTGATGDGHDHEDAAASPDTSTQAADGKDQQQASGDSGTSAADEAVISNMNNQTGRAYFDNIELQRRTYVSEQEERLNKIISDNANNTQNDTASAIEELHRLDATEERIVSLEEKLTTTYDNAVVEQDSESGTFKVVVQADKLDKSQAVGIVETAMKELQVTPDRVSVEYIPNP